MWDVGAVAFLFYGVLTAGDLLCYGCPIANSAQDDAIYGVVANVWW
jgi:hypothetical protein